MKGAIAMPILIRELTEEETAKLERTTGGGDRARIQAEYKDALSGLDLGKWGEIAIPDGEKKLTVKNRLNRAAQELGVVLSFRRTDDTKVLFKTAKQGELNLDGA